MTCQEALSLLYDIIDKEASEVDVQAVESHLKKCRHCFETFQVESDIQALIQARLREEEPVQELGTLKSKVLSSLDQLDQKEASAEKRRPFSSNVAGRILAAAASLVILIGAGYYAAELYEHQTRYIPLEQAHWGASQYLSSDNDATAQFVSLIEAQTGYHPAEVVGDFVLKGGHTDTVDGVEMRHLIYSDGERMVSVFLAAANDYAIPRDLLDNPVVHNHIKFFDHNCRGCRLVYHEVGNLVVITATTNRDVDLLAFNPSAGTI